MTRAIDVLFARRMKGHQRCWVEKIWTRRRAIEPLLMPRAWNVRSDRGPHLAGAGDLDEVERPSAPDQRHAARNAHAAGARRRRHAKGGGRRTYVLGGRMAGQEAGARWPSGAPMGTARSTCRGARESKNPRGGRPAGAVRLIAFRQVRDFPISRQAIPSAGNSNPPRGLSGAVSDKSDDLTHPGESNFPSRGEIAIVDSKGSIRGGLTHRRGPYDSR